MSWSFSYQFRISRLETRLLLKQDNHATDVTPAHHKLNLGPERSPVLWKQNF